MTYHDPDSGFCVLRVRVPRRSDLVPVVGRITIISAGEEIRAEGQWAIDPQHGSQFKAESLTTHTPTSAEGIRRYLASGAVRGIGPKLADKIVDLFGEKTLHILSDFPETLSSIPGIGRQTVAKIKASWREQQGTREIMLFLLQYGIGAGRAVRIYRLYGDQAVMLIRANPYRLADDIRGIGFQTADDLAKDLGLDHDAPERLEAGTIHALKQFASEGHCGVPADELVRVSAELLDVDIAPIETAIGRLVEFGKLSRERIESSDWLFLPRLHEAEVEIASQVMRLLDADHRSDQLDGIEWAGHPLRSVDVETELPLIEQRLGIELAAAQTEAVHEAASQRLLVITGGPGVGKTTLVRTLIELFEQSGCECRLAAPTGRAAKRLAETTAREATTLHRLLEFEPISSQFTRDDDTPLDGDVFIVDEVSMIDVVLADAFFRAVPPNAVVILVGDVDQLPSVGPGAVLQNLIDSRIVPTVRLTQIFRQSAHSHITRAAHSINAGEWPESPTDPEELSDFYFVECDEPEAVQNMIVRLINERIPQRFGFDPLTEVQVLSPMNRTLLGTQNLNQTLQRVLNPSSATEVTRFGWTFRDGDKVIQTVNNYDREVFNGDVGVIQSIDEDDQELIVEFEGRPVRYDFASLDELSLAYVLSIHKSQGSEYPAVIIPVHTQHFVMLRRNLIYTGLTRGKRLVVLVGSRRALELAISRSDDAVRRTTLKTRLLRAVS